MDAFAPPARPTYPEGSGGTWPASAAAAATRAAVAAHGATVYGLALTHTRCRADADEVYHEVFLAHYRAQPVCASEWHRKAWLVATTLDSAKRVAGGMWRSRAAAGQAPPPAFAFATKEQDAIFRAMSQLEEGDRAVMHLFSFDGSPIDEIAALLGMDVDTAKAHLSRGWARFRELLSKGGGDA